MTMRPSAPWSRRRLITTASLALMSAAVVNSGCAPDEAYGEVEPRALTSAEADRLAVMRFNNYDRHYAPITMTMTSDDRNFYLNGRVDFQDHLSYANALVGGESQSFALLQWNHDKVAAATTNNQTLPTQPPTDAAWEIRDLNPTKSGFDTGLAILLQLAADRPENPLLLKQNGARWHGKSTVDDTAVDVFTGPGSDGRPNDRLTYFLDARGSLRKVVGKVASSPDPIVIMIKSGTAGKITQLEGLA